MKSRFKFSFLSNGFRAVVTLLSTAVIARELGPNDFGVLVFLLAIFMALQSFLDLGSGKAFYTFLSQRPRGKQFFIAYFAWQALQFLLPVLVLLLLPENWVQQLWLHENRSIILLAFIAVFMKSNAWQTLIYIAESLRLTNRIQTWTLAVSVVHLVILIFLWWASLLSLPMVLGITITEYLVALGLVLKTSKIELPVETSFDHRKLWRDYKNYCIPLATFSVVSFGSVFVERWMLQKFGGSVEQAFFGISQQIGAGALLASTSFANIYWKEIAESHSQQNLERIKFIYQKSRKFLFFLTASICGFLIPWTKEIVSLFYGEDYIDSASILAIMLIPPVFSCLVDNAQYFLLATGQTKIYLKIRSLICCFDIPGSYFFLASKKSLIPGLALGARGIAIKEVLFSLVSAITTNWWITRKYRWKSEWGFKLLTFVIMLGMGHYIYEVIANIGFVFAGNLFLKGGLYFLLYTGMVGALLWLAPGLAGLNRQEIKSELMKLQGLFVKH